MSLLSAYKDNRKLLYCSGIAVILAAGSNWAWHLPHAMDITFGDEAQYLRYGVDLFHNIKKDWGPSYNLWYKALSLFTTNFVNLFYLNYQVTAVLAGLLLFVFLMRYRISFIISVWIAFCFFLSTTVIDTWPRVSHFAVILILSAMILVKNVDSKARKILWITLAFYFAAYARPELFSSFLLISAVTLFFLFKEKKEYKSWLPVFIIAVVLIAVNFFIYRLPADSYKGIDRTYIAFSQHYAINHVVEHKATFNPISEWIDFANKEFGGCANFSCILKTHFSKVLHHSSINIGHYIQTLKQFVVSILFPVKIYGSKKLQLIIFYGFLMLVILVLGKKEYRTRFFASLKSNALILLVLFVFGLPSMATSVLIYPRQHYLLMHSLLIIFVIAMLIDSIDVFRKIHPALIILFFIPVLFFSPKAHRYNYYQVEKENINKCNRNLVNYLTQKNDKQPHVIFSNHLSLSMMLPPNYSDFNTEYEFKTGMKFSEVAAEKKIDHILIRDILLEEKLLNSDSSWINFMSDPAAHGYKKQTFCDSCDSYLLVKIE